MRARTPGALLLCALLVAAAYAQPPAAGQPTGTGRDPPKDKEKEPSKGPTKVPEPKWPTNIAGKGVQDWLKEVTDPDPSVREFALKTLPNFGPDARKPASKLLIARMTLEKDPGVRIAVFNTAATLGLEDADVKEAVRILALTANEGMPGGLSRLHAVQTLAMVGPKAEPAVSSLVGPPCLDPAYETRRSVANTLGRIGIDEVTGPNHKALGALSGTLAKDVCAAVRMEALQSLVLLGPPWAEKRPPDAKGPPKIDWKAASVVADNMRARLGTSKTKGPVEADKQLEIWCRVVLMRFDEKEINSQNLGAIAKHIDPKSELGPKLQGLAALALFGESAGKQIDAVVGVLDDSDPAVLSSALTTLASMGVEAKPALPELEKLEKRWETKREEKKKDPEFVKALVNLKPDEVKFVHANLPEEQVRKAVADTIEFIKKSKPGLPGGDRPMATAPAPGDAKKP